MNYEKYTYNTSGYSLTVPFVLSDDKTDIYIDGEYTTDYQLATVGSDTVITFINLLYPSDTVTIYKYKAIALQEFKQHLRVTTSFEDDILRFYLDAAITFVEDLTSIYMYERDVMEVLEFELQSERITFNPVNEITYFKKYNHQKGIYEDQDYTANLDEKPATIYLKNDKKYYSKLEQPDKYKIEYKAGSTDFPNQMKIAVFIYGFGLFECKGDMQGATKQRYAKSSTAMLNQIKQFTF